VELNAGVGAVVSLVLRVGVGAALRDGTEVALPVGDPAVGDAVAEFPEQPETARTARRPARPRPVAREACRP
jgi:hypothetical protein